MGKMLRMANIAEFSKANKERISLSISQLPRLHLFVETKQPINSQLFACLFIEYNFFCYCNLLLAWLPSYSFIHVNNVIYLATDNIKILAHS